jgi:hypothetical protein
VHDAGRERAERRELLGLRDAVLGLAPVGDVLADCDDVRHVAGVEPHRNLRDAVRANLAAAARLHVELLEPAAVEDVLELPPQDVRGLAVQDVEDRATERVAARHAERPRLALVVPRLDSELAIDDVEAHRERVDHLGHEPTLFLDLRGAFRDLVLQPLRVLRVTDEGREHVGDGREEKPLVVEQSAPGLHRQHTDRPARGPKRNAGDRRLELGSGEESNRVHGRRRPAITPPAAAQIGRVAEPDRTVLGLDDALDRGEDLRKHGLERPMFSDGGRDLGERAQWRGGRPSRRGFRSGRRPSRAHVRGVG